MPGRLVDIPTVLTFPRLAVSAAPHPQDDGARHVSQDHRVCPSPLSLRLHLLRVWAVTSRRLPLLVTSGRWTLLLPPAPLSLPLVRLATDNLILPLPSWSSGGRGGRSGRMRMRGRAP
jgi:hypothetical protein